MFTEVTVEDNNNMNIIPPAVDLSRLDRKRIVEETDLESEGHCSKMWAFDDDDL